MRIRPVLVLSIIVGLPGLLIGAAPLQPSDYKADYSAELTVGSTCTIPLTQIHPTQAVVGMQEVEHKEAKIKKLARPDLTVYMLDHVVPIVIGPDGIPYMTDRHHTNTALLKSGRSPFAYCKIIANWSDKKPAAFWEEMEAHHYVWLMDAQGEPIPPDQLPTSISGLTDDPWRAVVWKLEHDGVISKKPIYYYEFYWANLLEKKVDADPSADFKGAIAASREYIENHPGLTVGPAQ